MNNKTLFTFLMFFLFITSDLMAGKIKISGLEFHENAQNVSTPRKKLNIQPANKNQDGEKYVNLGSLNHPASLNSDPLWKANLQNSVLHYDVKLIKGMAKFGLRCDGDWIYSIELDESHIGQRITGSLIINNIPSKPVRVTFTNRGSEQHCNLQIYKCKFVNQSTLNPITPIKYKDKNLYDISSGIPVRKPKPTVITRTVYIHQPVYIPQPVYHPQQRL